MIGPSHSVDASCFYATILKFYYSRFSKFYEFFYSFYSRAGELLTLRSLFSYDLGERSPSSFWGGVKFNTKDLSWLGGSFPVFVLSRIWKPCAWPFIYLFFFLSGVPGSPAFSLAFSFMKGLFDSGLWFLLSVFVDLGESSSVVPMAAFW